VLVAFAVLGMLVGGVIGYIRHPIYRGQARVFVGKTLASNNDAAVAGFPAVDAQVAYDYAQLIGTSTVAADAAQRLGHPSTLDGGLTAAAIPNSPVITVSSTGTSVQAAIALADAGASSLVDAVRQINQQATAQLGTLEQAYARDQTTVTQLSTQVQTLKSQLAALNAIAKPNATQQAEIASAQDQLTQLNTQSEVAALRANTDQTQYQSQVTSLQNQEEVLNRLGGAAYVGNDRKKYIVIGLLGGLIGGLVVGIAVATLIDLRRTRRLERAR
jgi:hypothetical protein